MKGKVIRGKGFRGCLDYLLRPDKGGVIIGGNMYGREPRPLAKEFAVVRQIRPDCEKPVLHVPLRLPKGEDIPDSKWRQIAVRYFELMDLSPDRPWLLVRHPDEHTHILTSRISLDCDLWYGKWEALNHIEATQALEKEFGLTITVGLEGKDAKHVRLTSGQLKKIDREEARGEEPESPAKLEIAGRIEWVLAECDGSFDDFKRRLEKMGVNLRLNQGETGPVTGISYELGGVKMKGSKVARAYGWKNLLKLLAERKETYEQQRNTGQNEKTSGRPNPDSGLDAQSAGVDQSLGRDQQPTAQAKPETPVVEIPMAHTEPAGPARSDDGMATIPDQGPGPGHDTDLQLAQETRRPAPAASEQPELTEEPEEQVEYTPPPRSLGR